MRGKTRRYPGSTLKLFMGEVCVCVCVCRKGGGRGGRKVGTVHRGFPSAYIDILTQIRLELIFLEAAHTQLRTSVNVMQMRKSYSVIHPVWETDIHPFHTQGRERSILSLSYPLPPLPPPPTPRPRLLHTHPHTPLQHSPNQTAQRKSSQYPVTLIIVLFQILRLAGLDV